MKGNHKKATLIACMSKTNILLNTIIGDERYCGEMLFAAYVQVIVMAYFAKNAMTVAVNPIVAAAMAGFSS